MANETVQRVAIWSGRLRFAHWLMASATLVLLLSGWLLHLAPALAVPLLDAHLAAGYGLVLALLLRGYLLLFGRAAEHWRDLLPHGPQLRAAAQTLRFYVTLGRAPLPAWYAHNPLWSPVYLALLAMLSWQAFTGLALDQVFDVGLRAWRWHTALAEPIAIVIALHVAAVFVHDLKGGGADTSAMISGYRCFRTGTPGTPVVQRHTVSLDALLRDRKKSGQ